MNCPSCQSNLLKAEGKWFCFACRKFVGEKPPPVRSVWKDALTAQPSALEAAFACEWTRYKCQYDGELPDYETEYEPFPDRKFRIDVAWPQHKMALELEGRDHAKTDRYARDVEKYNLLALSGWRLVRCTSEMMKTDPFGFFDQIVQALKGEKD